MFTARAGGWGAAVLATMLLLGAGGYTAMAQVEPAGVLSVTPADDFRLDGLASQILGQSKTYTLTNTGTAALEWKATWNSSFWHLSTPAGWLEKSAVQTLEPGASVAVTTKLGISPPPDLYARTTLYFTNLTNGMGSTSRGLIFWSRRPASMGISGGNASGVWIKGDTATSVCVADWSWENDTDYYLDWSVRTNQWWLTLDPYITHASRGCGGVRAYVNSQANVLAIGTHTATVNFSGAGTGLPDWQRYQTRTVTLKVVRPGDINADFAVDVADLLWMVGSWGKTSSQWGYNKWCDVNRDNLVDMADLLVFLEHWGEVLE